MGRERGRGGERGREEERGGERRREEEEEREGERRGRECVYLQSDNHLRSGEVKMPSSPVSDHTVNVAV